MRSSSRTRLAELEVVSLSRRPVGLEEGLRGPEHGKRVLLVEVVALDLLSEEIVDAPGGARPVGLEVFPAARRGRSRSRRRPSLAARPRGTRSFPVARERARRNVTESDVSGESSRTPRGFNDLPLEPGGKESSGILQSEEGVAVAGRVGEKPLVRLQLLVPAKHEKRSPAHVEDVVRARCAGRRSGLPPRGSRGSGRSSPRTRFPTRAIG